MEQCSVGMFNLPGLKFEKGQIPITLHEEMSAWAKENHCGTPMNEWLWSFKNEGQRDWFILRWTDYIPKVESEEKQN